MTNIAFSGRHVRAQNIWLLWFLAIARTMAETLHEWRHNYRSRRELASLSHRERYDLSFAGEVDAEIAKPFGKE